jgi:hypothetical protein
MTNERSDPMKCSECGHVTDAHHYYSRCEGTLQQPICSCLRTPTDVDAENAGDDDTV